MYLLKRLHEGRQRKLSSPFFFFILVQNFSMTWFVYKYWPLPLSRCHNFSFCRSSLKPGKRWQTTTTQLRSRTVAFVVTVSWVVELIWFKKEPCCSNEGRLAKVEDVKLDSVWYLSFKRCTLTIILKGYVVVSDAWNGTKYELQICLHSWWF